MSACTALHCAKHKIDQGIPEERSESPAQSIRVDAHVNHGVTGIVIKKSRPRYARGKNTRGQGGI